MSKKVRIFFVGPGKTGTTWIYNVLKYHPDLEVSAAKETLYFSEAHDRGEEWYHSHWSSKNKVRAEFSNTYSFENIAVDRIYNYNPNAKIIFTCRNPIDRIISHAKFLIRNGSELFDLNEILKARPDIVERSHYWKLIQNYRRRFSDENIGIFFFEDMTSNNLNYINNICDFIGVSKLEKLPNSPPSSKLPASLPRSKTLIRFLKKLIKIFRTLGLAKLVLTLKFNPVILKLLFRPWQDGHLSYRDSDLNALRRKFAESNNMLSKLSNSEYPSKW